MYHKELKNEIMSLTAKIYTTVYKYQFCYMLLKTTLNETIIFFLYFR